MIGPEIHSWPMCLTDIHNEFHPSICSVTGVVWHRHTTKFQMDPRTALRSTPGFMQSCSKTRVVLHYHSVAVQMASTDARVRRDDTDAGDTDYIYEQTGV